MAPPIFFFSMWFISASVLRRSSPVSGTIVVIYRLGKVSGVSVMIAVWQSLLCVTPRYRYRSFIVLEKFPSLLDQGWRYNLLDHCTDPWSRSRLWVPDLGFWSEYSFLYTSWAWMIFPFFVSPIFRLISFRGMGWFSFKNSLWIFLTIMSFSRYVCHNSYSICEIGNTY